MTRNPIDKYRFQNPEVAYSDDEIVHVRRADLDALVEHSSRNPRKRVRLCAHSDPRQPLHEMLIVHERSAYVRPHRHPGKSESMHVIAGLVDVVIFDDLGDISRVIEMGDYASGKTFYYRMATPLFHTLLIHSDVLVFHETTDGPFKSGSSVFPDWAPDGADALLVEHYVHDLDQRIKSTTGTS
jgi:cupin fold WbuC family metalloprotein